MPVVVILGAGPIGANVAHRVAQRAIARRVLLVDEQADAAAGKALDILQSGPVERFGTAIAATADPLHAVGAAAVVLADHVHDGEWDDDRGFALVQQLVRAGCRAPLVFAGPRQLSLMERCHRELHVPAARLIGSAPAAMAGAGSALAAAELHHSGVELAVVGRPPAFVACWSSAVVGGSLVTSLVAGHRLLALSGALRRLWPPAAYAIASATAAIVEALVSGGRRLTPGATIVENDLGVRGKAILLPLEIGVGRITRYVIPSLSAQERTDLISSAAS